VRALLRRGLGAQTTIGTLDWSWELRQASIGDEHLNLSAKELTLLESLLSQADRVVSKETLTNRMGDSEMAAGENTVEVYVHRLRRKLAPAGLEIVTIRGVGYLLREVQDGG
jgi:DNA-binding response OmpR family regulator